MSKAGRVQFILFITALIMVILLGLPIQAAVKQKSRQVLTKTNGTYLALSWGDIWKKLGRRKVPGGGRGPEEVKICAIAPGRLDSTKMGIQEIWSVQPLFLWDIQGGTLQQIDLLNRESKQVFWSQKIPTGQTKVIYSGKPLQPGQSYIWRLSYSSTARMTYYQFKIMEIQKRDHITNDLAQLEKQLKIQRTNAEKIALEKANYFMQQELWSDALREIYSVSNPSAELTKMIQKIPSSNYCKEAKVIAATKFYRANI